MRRLALLVLLFLLPTLVMCEETAASLPSAANAQEVEQFLLFPSKFSTCGVEKG